MIASGREGKEPIEESRNEAEAVKKIYSVKRFEYVKESDAWRCPDGRLLVREDDLGIKDGDDPSARYVCQSCESCSLSSRCFKQGETWRTLLVKRKQIIRAEMRARLKKPEKQAIYRKRKWAAEQVIGQIKDGMGFREVTMRGKDNARGQWLFACATHNVMKAVRFISGLRKGDMARAMAC